jgi:hypothetical protein
VIVIRSRFVKASFLDWRISGGAKDCGMNDLGSVQHDDVGNDYMSSAVTFSDDAESRAFGAMLLVLLSRLNTSHADNEDLHYNTRGHRLSKSRLSVYVVVRCCRCRCYSLKAP